MWQCDHIDKAETASSNLEKLPGKVIADEN
jgi:hypothetical protein